MENEKIDKLIDVLDRLSAIEERQEREALKDMFEDYEGSEDLAAEVANTAQMATQGPQPGLDRHDAVDLLQQAESLGAVFTGAQIQAIHNLAQRHNVRIVETKPDGFANGIILI